MPFRCSGDIPVDRVASAPAERRAVFPFASPCSFAGDDAVQVPLGWPLVELTQQMASVPVILADITRKVSAFNRVSCCAVQSVEEFSLRQLRASGTG